MLPVGMAGVTHEEKVHDGVKPNSCSTVNTGTWNDGTLVACKPVNPEVQE